MITKLTKKQEEAIIPYREKWIQRILRTEQDDEQIKENIKGIYRIAGLKEPKEVWIMDSMFGVQVAINFLKNSKGIKDIRNNIENNIRNNIWNNIENNIENNIRNNIGNNIRNNIENNIWNNIWNNIRNNIRNNIWNNIWNNIRNNIENNIRNNIWNNIRNNIENNIRNNIKNNIRNNIWNNIENNIENNIRNNIGNNKLKYIGFSSNEASWLQWFIYQKFYFDNGLLLPDKYSELLNSYIEMAIDAWAVYYSEDIAIVSRKPDVIQDSRQMLHSTTKPAVSFKDGYELYYLHGVHFEKELWEKVVSGEMSFADRMKIEDVDQRTQAINPQFADIDSFIKEAKGELLDEYNKFDIQGNQVNYRLYKFPKGEIFTEDAYYCYFDCPSTRKKHLEGVEVSKTVAEAMAWAEEISEEDFILRIPLVHET